jgi:hypothetical protein
MKLVLKAPGSMPSKLRCVGPLLKFGFKFKLRRYTVGLIIDLTNHDCLYTDGVPPTLERVHVRNVAKSIPQVECTAEVIQVANEFWVGTKK